MKTGNMTYFKNFRFRALGLALFAALALVNFAFADVAEECGSYDPKNHKLNNECPTGTRNDISAKCLMDLNKDNKTCLNTMPTDNVVRVPEDVCFRGEGWNRKRNHNAMDYAAVAGTPIYAAADGIIDHKADTNSCTSGGGRGVWMLHAKGGKTTNIRNLPKSEQYQTIYLHLSEVTVVVDSFVKKGTLIGKMGGSDCKDGKIIENAYGSHLHFEIRDGNGQVINPMCEGVQELCGSSEKMDTKTCRTNCKENPTACQAISYVNKPTGAAAVSSSSASAVEQSKRCDYNKYLSSFKSCIFCDVFTILFNTASSIAVKAYNVFAYAIQGVVIVGMAVWLALLILKYISAMEVKDPRKMTKEILNQAFVVLMVIIFLRMDSASFLAIFMEPIFNTGFKLARIASHGGACNYADFSILTTGGIPASMGFDIVCTVSAIQDRIIGAMSIGSTLMCMGLFERSWHFIPIFPHLGFLFSGILIWISAFLLLVIYPWLLINSVLQLSVAAALLPAAIGCYAFKITRKHVTKIFDTFMNAIFTFVFLSIIIYIITAQIEVILGDEMIKSLKDSSVNNDDLLQNFSWTGMKLLHLVFVLLLGWAVLGKTKEFADEFGGGLKITGIGESVGGLGASAAHGVTKLGMKAGGGALKWGGRKTGNAIIGAVASARVKHMSNKIKNNQNAVTNADGSVTVTSKNWKGQQVTRTLSQGASGQNQILKTREKRNGKTVQTATDKFARIKTVQDKNGNEIRSNVVMTSAMGKNLLNKDGSINTFAMNYLRKNSGHDADTMNRVILERLMKERLPNLKGASMNKSYKSIKIETKEDDQGRETFSVRMVNKNGTESVFKMTTNEGGDRIMTEFSQIDAAGRYGLTHSTDGIINKRSAYEMDKDGKIIEGSEENEYSFTDYYLSLGEGRPIDSYGTVADYIPAGSSMYGIDDREEMSEQHIKNLGRGVDMDEFRK